MMLRMFAGKRPALMSATLVALLSFSSAGCATPAQSNSKHTREDARTCESFGARYGTPAYTNCMIDQQRRRDVNKVEESRMLSRLAKDGQIMADRARRQRCDRDPDRRECRRK